MLSWVSCVIQPEKIEIFSVMGRRRQFSLLRRFLQGPTLGRKLVWTLASIL